MFITGLTFIVNQTTAIVSTLFTYFMIIFAPFINYIATHYRPLAMVLVVLPLSFVLRNVMSFRDYLYTTFIADATMEGHETRVERVINDLTTRLQRPAKERRFLCTARAPWQNLSTRFADYKKSSDCIFVGDFRNVLSLNPPKTKDGMYTVTLEPLVDVGMATRWLLPHGYMLATTLEIEEATIGGLACAVGMTTASHKYGLLQETVESYEIILGDGTRVHATRTNKYSDLWHAFPWSHGSLGLLVGLTLQIIPVQKYVQVTYTNCNGSISKYSDSIRKASLKDPLVVADFVEATVFSRTECVLMEASFVPESKVHSSQINNVGWWFKKWFYTHVYDFCQTGGDDAIHIEYIPTYQYIFRHNRGIFWTLRDQLPEKYGNNIFFRYLLGWLNPPKVTFLKMPATPEIKKEMMIQRVYQDIVLPLHTLEQAIELAGDLFEIWPILVYPSRIYDHNILNQNKNTENKNTENMQGQFRCPRKEDLVKGTNYAMYYDLGVYGIPKQVLENDPLYKPVTSMRIMEKFTSDHRGAPFLYANTFMNREEFGHMFDMELYEKMRIKYGANQHFHHLYNKTAGCLSFDFEEMLKDEEMMGSEDGKKKK